MTIRTLVNRIKRSRSGLEEVLLKKYRATVMPYWRAAAARNRTARCRTYIMVTGSCGKTTTTMLTGVLLGSQSTAASSFNKNTEHSVMRAIRKLDRPVDAFVQEASEFPRGALARAATALAPDVAVVTSVDLDHLVEFRTREAVAEEIGTLTAAIGTAGAVCLNADDEYARGLARGARARVILFGRTADADIRAENVRAEMPERLSFDLVVGARRRRVQTRFVGTLMLTNILGALAVIHALDLDLDRAVADLAAIEPLKNRMAVVEVPGGHTLLVDTIKAPEWSTHLLIDDLPNIWSGRRIFVLGELSDKGNNSGAKYRRMLRSAAARADLVIGVNQSQHPASRVKRTEPHLPIQPVASLAELEAVLREQPPSLVVLKGNSFKIDAMVERFASPPASMPA